MGPEVNLDLNFVRQLYFTLRVCMRSSIELFFWLYLHADYFLYFYVQKWAMVVVVVQVGWNSLQLAVKMIHDHQGI